MADTQLDNLSGQITILKSALEGLAISFGEILMPKIRAAAKKIQEFVDKLNGMNDEQKETVVKIAAVVAAIGPMLILFGKVTSTVGTAMKGFSGLTKGIAKLGVKIAGSSGSITGLGSALGAVAGAAAHLGQRSCRSARVTARRVRICRKEVISCPRHGGKSAYSIRYIPGAFRTPTATA